MALDTICVSYIVEELAEKIVNGRIEKIYQPERDEVILLIRTYDAAYRLLLSAGAAYPRVQLTEAHKENPPKPPMLCMLMRKHLSSGKIISVSQPNYERIIKIDIESYNELGDLTVKHLFAELMGRHSNIILTDDNMKIIDSVKHVDFTMSSVRQILPGGEYTYPPMQSKPAVLSDFGEPELDFNMGGARADKVIMSALSGIAPISAREAVYRVLGRTDAVAEELTEEQKKRLAEETVRIKNYPKQPCILTERQTGKILDFSSFDIHQYGDAVEKQYFKTVNELLDNFYRSRDNAERMKQKSSDLVHFINTLLERLTKKRTILLQTVSDAQNRDKYKMYADLITANIYKIKQGDTEVRVENFYSEACEEITLELSPGLSPSQNAQKYYKMYTKAKIAAVEAQKQLELARRDIEYLDSTLALTLNAQSEAEIGAIKAELCEQGYMRLRTKGKKQRNTSTPKPYHFISSDGLDIYVGKNNTQNDYLTLKFANREDMWFHTKKIHGSHAVIKLGEKKDIPESTMREAAELAAYYSRARESSQVPVDYTRIKNVKKPNGAKPGMVIYDSYNTVYVKPAQRLEPVEK